jgi:glycosyltransferase involved in cell wall biosynthesis
MKIALFIPSLEAGGAERVVVLLANELSARGLDVDLLLVQKKGPHLASLSGRVNVVALARKGVLASFFAIRNYVNEFAPAYFISHLDHANVVTALVRLSCPASKTKFFLTEHITPSEWFRNTPSVKSKLVHILGKIFYRYADRVIVVSQGVARDVASFYHVPEDKISVIYNPVVGKDLMQKASGPCVPFFEGHADYILGMGRLVEQKDFFVLLKAFRMLAGRDHLNLLILGEGPQRGQLEDMIREYGLEKNVKLPGHISNPYPYLKQAKAFVLSSRREALPTVLIEALALGVPVVATDCPHGPSEILDKGRLGRMVNVGDARTLAQAIEETLISPLPFRKCDVEKYTVDFAVNEYMQLLRGA